MYIVCMQFKDSDNLIGYGYGGAQEFPDLDSAKREIEKIKTLGSYQRGEIVFLKPCRVKWRESA